MFTWAILKKIWKKTSFARNWGGMFMLGFQLDQPKVITGRVDRVMIFFTNLNYMNTCDNYMQIYKKYNEQQLHKK